jgi:4-diphosphocytidyl-2-C-methyl-D-erythritol kinase
LGRAFRINLRKTIPSAAGLGGGSSDAAAALRLCHALWNRKREHEEARLLDRRQIYALAGSLGSDVPFFLAGGTQLATGRGEELEPLGQPPEQWLVVLTPAVRIERKTARLYALIGPEHYTDGSRSRELAMRLKEAQPRFIKETDIYNVFDAVAHQAFPRIGLYRDFLRKTTGSPAHLCGAGPSLFALCADRTTAVRAEEEARAMNLTAWAVRTLNRPASTHF